MGTTARNFSVNDWDAYVSDLLISGHVSAALFYDLSSGKVLASNRNDFRLSAPEYGHIVKSFSKPLVFRRTGFTVNGEHYKTHMADGKMGLMGKCGLPARGCSVCKTRDVLIVAVHDGTMDSVKCNEVVMNMGDFFNRKGL